VRNLYITQHPLYDELGTVIWVDSLPDIFVGQGHAVGDSIHCAKHTTFLHSKAAQAF
jgi:hypothetical protein